MVAVPLALFIRDSHLICRECSTHNARWLDLGRDLLHRMLGVLVLFSPFTFTWVSKLKDTDMIGWANQMWIEFE